VTETHAIGSKEKIRFIETFENWPCNE